MVASVERCSVTRLKLAAMIAAGTTSAVCFVPATSAQHTASLAGRWTLSCELSQFPREVGFGADLIQDAPGSDSAGGRGRGRGRSSGGSGAFPSRRESEDDVARAQRLTGEVVLARWLSANAFAARSSAIRNQRRSLNATANAAPMITC